MGLWSGIPAAQALGLSAVLSGLAAVLGNPAAVTLVVAAHGFWERRLGRWVRRGGEDRRAARGRLERVWASPLGLPGVAVLSPLLMGAPLGTLVAPALGAPRGRLLRWMVASVAAWGAVLAVVAAFDLSVFGD